MDAPGEYAPPTRGLFLLGAGFRTVCPKAERRIRNSVPTAENGQDQKELLNAERGKKNFLTWKGAAVVFFPPRYPF